MKKILTGIAAFCICAAIQLHAQGRGGGFGGGGGGGFGGFGGFGGIQGANRGGATGTSQYGANGTVGNATIYYDPDTKNIVIIGDDPTTAQIKSVVAGLDRPKSQVLIKVVFLEVQHNKAKDIGIEGTYGNNLGNSMTGTLAHVFGQNGLNSITTNFNPTGPVGAVPALTAASPGSGLYQLLGSDFQATLRAIASAGKAELLSRPSVLARDGQPATIVVGQSVPLVNGVTYYTSGGSTIPINNVAYTDVGIILKVTPYISDEGYVEMILQPSTTAVNTTQGQVISPGVVAPYLDVRSADTVVVTPDAQTVVIGGLIGMANSDAESKIPYLGDIPLLGNLFKRKTSSGARTELLIFLTPHIVHAPGQLAAMSSHEQENTLTPKSYSEEELDRFLERVPVKQH
jgi:general secretion pathway protein D